MKEPLYNSPEIQCGVKVAFLLCYHTQRDDIYRTLAERLGQAQGLASPVHVGLGLEASPAPMSNWPFWLGSTWQEVPSWTSPDLTCRNSPKSVWSAVPSSNEPKGRFNSQYRILNHFSLRCACTLEEVRYFRIIWKVLITCLDAEILDLSRGVNDRRLNSTINSVDILPGWRTRPGSVGSTHSDPGSPELEPGLAGDSAGSVGRLAAGPLH